jgi:hypothetical protein
MLSLLHDSDHSSYPALVGDSHNEKDVAVTTKASDEGLDLAIASDDNPGELTFEEGQSLQ